MDANRSQNSEVRIQKKNFWVLISGFCLLLFACVPSTKPSLKIVHIGPFEGRYRDVGYEVTYAMRLAIREANAKGGVGGYTIEFMEFDDSGDPELAKRQAKKAATDPLVVAVLGNWLSATTQPTAAALANDGLPFVAVSPATELPASTFRLWNRDSACPSPCITLEEWFLNRQLLITNYFIAPAPLPQDSADPSFAERYKKISHGVEPRFLAPLAYDATRIILQAIERDAQKNGISTREGVSFALTQTAYEGLSGRVTFDEKRNWVEGKGWVYKWESGKITKP
jgi:ABC-type branched-subunit amino acid transport system substrate-binding protein